MLSHPHLINKPKESPMNRAFSFFGNSQSDWLPIKSGESGDFVFRRGDGQAYAKIAPPARRAELAGERDRLVWLKGRGVTCSEVISWQEEQEGACLVMTAIPGAPAADLSGPDLLKAWPSMARQLGILHELPADQCPFDRSLSIMFERAADVVARNAVNPDFLPDEDTNTGTLAMTCLKDQLSGTARLDYHHGVTARDLAVGPLTTAFCDLTVQWVPQDGSQWLGCKNIGFRHS
jgi:streptomycin 3"-kinase